MTPATYSRLLVTAQFLLFAALVASLVVVPARTFPLLAVVGAGLLLAGALALGLAFAAFRRVNRAGPNIIPEPRRDTDLVTTGIYSYVRHPIYTGVILCAMGLASIHGTGETWLIAGLLLVLFHFKARHEETLLLAAFPQYADYQRTTGRFFPYLSALRRR